MFFFALSVALAAANDVQIKRHAVIDHKAISKLMRQEANVSAKHKVESDDDVLSNIEDLLKESDAEKQQSETMLKHSSDDIVKQEEDKNIFKEADEDRDGALDPNEMDLVMTKAGLADTGFDWHAHDQDQDGKLSEDEFMAAGKEAKLYSKPRSLSLLENYILQSKGPSKLMKLKDFKSYDSDASGTLDKSEASNLMEGVGLEGNAWHKFDMDGDGKISEDEFNKDLAALNKDTATANPGVDEDQAIFKASDSDSSSFLEEGEIDSLLGQIPALRHHPFDWHEFDFNNDGRLSYLEFMRAGPAVVQAVRSTAFNGTSPVPRVPPSFVEEDEGEDEYNEVENDEEQDHEEDHDAVGEDEDEEDEEDHKADDEDVQSRVSEDFRIADKNHDGFLDEHELEDFAKEAGVSGHWNWKSADKNNDDKLDQEELFNLARMSSQDEKIDPEPDDEEEEHKHMQ